MTKWSFITAGEQEWTLGVIDFATDPPTGRTE